MQLRLRTPLTLTYFLRTPLTQKSSTEYSRCHSHFEKATGIRVVSRLEREVRQTLGMALVTEHAMLTGSVLVAGGAATFARLYLLETAIEQVQRTLRAQVPAP